MNGIETLRKKLNDSIKQNIFIRLTLSKKRENTSDLKKVIIKLITIKKLLHLSFVYRHLTKDITKNFLLEHGIPKIDELILTQFYIANLFTLEEDFSLEILTNGKELFRSHQPSFKALPNRKHDKTKIRLIEGIDYLTALGVLDQKGRIIKDKGDKFKQINKFIEIIDNLFRQYPKFQAIQKINVVDMGSGKGYLTFALYDYLTNVRKINPTVKGIEIRDDLIQKCNQIAEDINFHQLQFEKGLISDIEIEKTDILIALHACDTATDDAIFKGIRANAGLIICAPCCHKQIRRQMGQSLHLQPVIDFGIFKERQAEMITDTIRALLLEANGYKTKVFEFISTEHTGKNIMIIGQKHSRKIDNASILEKINQLKSEFGIEFHYLEQLLGA